MSLRKALMSLCYLHYLLLFCLPLRTIIFFTYRKYTLLNGMHLHTCLSFILTNRLHIWLELLYCRFYSFTSMEWTWLIYLHEWLIEVLSLIINLSSISLTKQKRDRYIKYWTYKTIFVRIVTSCFDETWKTYLFTA